MNILGINHYFHDTSVCLIVGGELVAALEEERFNRHKHTTVFPAQAAARCLAMGGLTPADIDHVAVSAEPTHKWQAKMAYAAKQPRGARGFLKTEMRRYWSRRQSLQRWMEELWPSPGARPRLHHVQHHLAHVGGSFLVSGFDEAALLGIDGSGEWATSLMGHARDTEIEVFQHSWFPMSLGSFFEAVTDWCGFRPNYDEGKTMGLAPYGDATRFYDRVAKLVRVDEDGGIWLDLSYFNHQFHGHRRYSQKFVDTFGPPRVKDKRVPFEEHHQDVAAAFQRVLEDRVLEMCHILHQRTNSKRLVLAGGVALNSVMNGRIVRESPFEDLYVMPGAGDNGTCIGAAYYAYHCVLGQPRCAVHDDPYVGTSYSDDDIRATLEACRLPLERHDDIEDVAADLLTQGHMLGWFQGRMEFGPRALGSRTILANPTLTDTKAILNARVKHREAFRPFAPACPSERAAEFFDSRVETPFMLKVCNVLPAQRERLPAITHVDGSARLQTVHQRLHPRFHKLCTAFGERTGVPVVLNTSFNVMGEPIVESPLQAIRCFFSTGLDELVLGSYLVRKQPAS
ncbi:carbamoyltransferase family protein [Haliangium sp.]|uniref:carbamoyltransferase family protein n=1 Tax=Haliangium sp. TaxID=2663208 RepID=UPI003D0D08B3